jgi:membrane protease YdiL (CAAX protease family)
MAALSLLWVVALIYGTVTLLPSLYADPMVEFREEGRGIAYTLFAVAVCPAVVEELLFRGVILTGLRGVFNTRIAVVVSGMMFATIHLSVISFVSHSLLGIIFGALCVRSRSLWPSMIAHAAWNAGWVLWG